MCPLWASEEQGIFEVNKMEITKGNHKDSRILLVQPPLQTLHQAPLSSQILPCMHLQG